MLPPEELVDHVTVQVVLLQEIFTLPVLGVGVGAGVATGVEIGVGVTPGVGVAPDGHKGGVVKLGPAVQPLSPAPL